MNNRAQELQYLRAEFDRLFPVSNRPRQANSKFGFGQDNSKLTNAILDNLKKNNRQDLIDRFGDQLKSGQISVEDSARLAKAVAKPSFSMGDLDLNDSSVDFADY